MRKELQQELQHLMMSVVLEDAETALENESIYEWNDYEADRHFRGNHVRGIAPCKPVTTETSTLKEEHFYQFADTMDEGSKMVLTVTGVFCSCGKLQNKTMRAEGTLSEFLPRLFLTQG